MPACTHLSDRVALCVLGVSSYLLLKCSSKGELCSHTNTVTIITKVNCVHVATLMPTLDWLAAFGLTSEIAHK